MGKSGDQELHFMQNRTLNESKTNGIDVPCEIEVWRNTVR